jgi:hypothetical protein
MERKTEANLENDRFGGSRKMGNEVERLEGKCQVEMLQNIRSS